MVFEPFPGLFAGVFEVIVLLIYDVLRIFYEGDAADEATVIDYSKDRS